MDVFSHGLWGSIVFGRKNRRSFWSAFLFGVLPDLLAFAPHTIAMTIGVTQMKWQIGEPPDPSLIPPYVYDVYNFSHSLVVFLVIFLIVWFIRHRPLYEMLAWPLHILVDIPTHSNAFFPTPFLWPFSDFYVSGIPWGDPRIFLPNVVTLTILYIFYFVILPRRRRAEEKSQS